MSSGERIEAFDGPTVERIEANLADRDYYELLTELETNDDALQDAVQRAIEARRLAEEMMARKSLLLARRQALMEEIQRREQT
jgi:hypothetical protein